ncbi:MAG TPA: hypothetical protein IAD38_03040 [Candidatus Egerieenecus merdigallinarum]|nr:hypothetical protein [Candidatus Egerieenecus merdigallinarum]
METLKEETSGFVACKSSGKHGPEGFQRATGKPFGRARRRETLWARKKDIAKYLASNLKGRAPTNRGTAFHTIFLVTE